MLSLSNVRVEIIKCDNGYVLEWHDNGRDRHSVVMPERATYGYEVYTSKKAALKAAERYL